MSDKIEKSTESTRTFNYKKRGVTLTFTVRVDEGKQIRETLDILKEAQSDLEELVIDDE